MSLARGKFGVEYNPRQQQREPSLFGPALAVVALGVLVLLTWTLVRRMRTHAAEAELAEAEKIEDVLAPPPAAATGTSQTFQAFQPLNTALAKRPAKVRNLLLRLEEAEKRHDVSMAVTTIEAIRALPGSPAADLDDSLARLNGGRDKVEKIVIGQKLHVMNHPRFNLVLHRRTKTADLALNGKFFKRYDLGGEVKAREGAYEMPERRRLFWQGIGSCFKDADRSELDELLPKATPILVSEM